MYLRKKRIIRREIMSDIYSSPRGLITALATTIATPPPPPSFPMPLRDFFLLSIPFPSGFVSLRRSPLPLRIYSSLSLFLSLSHPLFFPSPYSLQRDDDQTSAITLLLFASLPLLFLVLFRLRFFCSYLPFAKTSARYRRGRGSAHCNFNQERCTREARQLVASARVR